MNREQAKEISEMIETHGIEVIKAYGEGKIIQHLNLDGEWVDCDMPISFVNNHSFRVKPELSEIKPITPEEKELIVSTPITRDCFDLPLKYEETLLEDFINKIEILRFTCASLDKGEFKDKVFNTLISMLPSTYKVVKL